MIFDDIFVFLKYFGTILLITLTVSAGNGSFDNFRVYRVTPGTQKSLEALHELEESPGDLDFWKGVTGIGGNVDVMVPPHLWYQFENIARNLTLDYQITINNVQELIDQETVNVTTRDAAVHDWKSYQTLDQIYEWMRSVAAKNPKTVSIIKGGSTHEGRDILGVRIRFKNGNERRSVFIDGNIHAREWISSAVATYLINALITNQDPILRSVAENHDWYIFPVINPDGFVHSHSHADNRMWRKTRYPYVQSSPQCWGADPNRNWAYKYNSGGTSSDPCSLVYRGPKAFSEKCTKTLSNFISRIGKDLKAYISFHSYGQMLLLPYGYTSEHLDNYDELLAVGKKMVASLAKRHGTQYQVGNILDIIKYVASGGSMDWVKGTFKTRLTYTYELRNKFSFILPAKQIIPTAEETVDSIVTMFREFEKL